MFSCVLNSVSHITALLDPTGNCQFFLSSGLSKLAVLSLTSLISFNKAVMKALQRNLGLIRASLLSLELAETWGAPGTFSGSEGTADAGAESKISCPGCPGCCPGLGMMTEQRGAEQGTPRTWAQPPAHCRLYNFMTIAKLLLSFFSVFPLFEKLSEHQFFIHKCRNDLSPFFVESQIFHGQKISPLICSTSDRAKATAKNQFHLV